MDIGFSEEQELLREAARKFLDAECDSKFVRARMAEPAAVTDEFWRQLAEQGWLGIVYPEAHGGSGLVDLVVLMEEMRRRVMPGPFFSTVLLGGAAIAEARSPAAPAKSSATSSASPASIRSGVATPASSHEDAQASQRGDQNGEPARFRNRRHKETVLKLVDFGGIDPAFAEGAERG